MPRTHALRRAATVLGLLCLLPPRAFAQPSGILNTYVLFAQDNLRIRTTSPSISDGDLGVNDGLLYMRGTVLAPNSDFAADIVHMDSSTDCEDLFTNALVGSATSCPKRAGAVPHPLLATDLATACGFPPAGDFDCSSNPADDVLVDHNQSVSLPPAPPGKKYGNLVVEGGGEGPAILKLAGDYHFCNVRVGRNGSILFTGPSTVTVAGEALVSNATDVKPDPALAPGALPPGAIKLFVQGDRARFSRKGDIQLYACAPNAKMVIGSGTSLTGRFVARSIRMKKSSITFAPPVPGVCGDTVLSPGEACEANTDCSGGLVCNACQCVNPTTTTTTTLPPPCNVDEDCGSPGGGFVCENGHCVPACHEDADCNVGSPTGSFVCENGHCIPGCTKNTDCTGEQVCEDGHCVTTTTTTTTTGPSTTTTTTTLVPCTTDADCPVGVCREGYCVPECQTDEDCNQGSPGGSFVCIDGRCVAGGEICGDCIDNDGDGLVDFEDPDCCAVQAEQVFPMDLRKGRFRPRGGNQTALRLKGGLARSGLASKIDPRTQTVVIQIHSEDTGEVLCASIPAGKFTKKRKAFRFSQKRTPLPIELGRNLDRVQIKVLKNGLVRYRVRGKRASLATPAQGTLQITVGFARPGTPASQNVCSQAVRVFRGGKKGQLTFP